MTEEEVLKSAFAMPLTSPAYPKPPFRFVDREFIIITYRTDPAALARVVPAPLKVTDPIVKYEFIKMPDSTGLGSYTESGQVIPVTFEGTPGGYTHAMYLDNLAGIAAGRELLGFPKVLAAPKLEVHSDSLVGTLDYNGVRVATATMTYKYHAVDAAAVKKIAGGSRISAENHAARGRLAAHLRTGALQGVRFDRQGCMDRPGVARIASALPRDGVAASRARSVVRHPYSHGFVVGRGRGDSRLSRRERQAQGWAALSAGILQSSQDRRT